MKPWGDMTHADKLASVKEHVVLKGVSYRDYGALVTATKNQIAGFIYNNRPELYGYPRPEVERSSKPKGEANGNSYHTEASLTEKWSAKQHQVRNPSPQKRPGAPMVIPPGSDKERQFRSLWAEGAQYKVMAEELGVSEKALKDARLRLNLPTRRPNLGKAVDFRVRFDPATVKKLRMGTTRRGSTRASYLRFLIHRDNP